jgi:hypothetical protein
MAPFSHEKVAEPSNLQRLRGAIRRLRWLPLLPYGVDVAVSSGSVMVMQARGTVTSWMTIRPAALES